MFCGYSNFRLRGCRWWFYFLLLSVLSVSSEPPSLFFLLCFPKYLEILGSPFKLWRGTFRHCLDVPSPQMRLVSRRTSLGSPAFCTSRSFPEFVRFPKAESSTLSLENRRWQPGFWGLRAGRDWARCHHSASGYPLSSAQDGPTYVYAENPLIHLFQRLNLRSSTGRIKKESIFCLGHLGPP